MATVGLALTAQVIGFGLFLWLGLYLLVRSTERAALIVIAIVGLFAQAAYFASAALADASRDLGTYLLLQRGFWWTTVVPAAAWFHLSRLIERRVARGGRPAQPLFTRLVAVVYTAAAFIILLGSLTDLFVDFSHAGLRGALYDVDPGPAYSLFVAFIGLTAAGALANVVVAWRAARSTDRRLARRLWPLAGGALFFLIGALWVAAREGWSLPLSVVPGYLFVFVGLAGLGYGVANYGLLLEGQNVERDVLYSFTGILLLNLLYVVLLTAAGLASAAGLLVLVALVTLTHLAYDNGRTLLDRWFFSPDEREARSEARAFATVLGTAPALAPPHEAEPPCEAPDLPDLKPFKDQVRKALTGLKSPPRLAQSPLLALGAIERRVAQAGVEDNRLNRVAALRDLLLERIAGLRPEDDGEEHHVGDAWRFYNVLYYPYVLGVSRKSALVEARQLADARRRHGRNDPEALESVLLWLADVDEDTFYKWQRRASDLIAEVLWEEFRRDARPG